VHSEKHLCALSLLYLTRNILFRIHSLLDDFRGELDQLQEFKNCNVELFMTGGWGEAMIMALYAKNMALIDSLGNLIDADETGCKDAAAMDAEGEHGGEGAAASLDLPTRWGTNTRTQNMEVSSFWTKYKQCYYVPHKTSPSTLNLSLIATSYSHSIHASH
jgi:hypothetical protein